MDSVFRALLVYLVLLVVTRAAGRRTLAQITVFDFVLLTVIAETSGQVLPGDDYSLTGTVIVILTLVIVDVLLAYAKALSPRLNRIIDGVPTVLIATGKIDHDALRRARVNLTDVMESARDKHGLRRLDQIDFAVLEVGGAISIIAKDEKAPP